MQTLAIVSLGPNREALTTREREHGGSTPMYGGPPCMCGLCEVTTTIVVSIDHGGGDDRYLLFSLHQRVPPLDRYVNSM